VTAGFRQAFQAGTVFIIPGAEGGRTEVVFLGGGSRGEWRIKELPE
jgi:hypothetical protein